MPFAAVLSASGSWGVAWAQSLLNTAVSTVLPASTTTNVCVSSAAGYIRSKDARPAAVTGAGVDSLVNGDRGKDWRSRTVDRLRAQPVASSSSRKPTRPGLHYIYAPIIRPGLHYTCA